MKNLFPYLISTLLAGAAAAQGQSTAVTPKEKALQAKTVAEVLYILGVQSPEVGKLVLLKVPDIVGEGKKVSVEVISKMAGTDWIAVLADRNAVPLVHVQEFSPGTDRSVGVTVDLTQTSRIRALVRAGGKYYQVSREVKVATAGCGKQ